MISYCWTKISFKYGYVFFLILISDYRRESPFLFLHMNLTNSTGTGLSTTEAFTSDIEATATATATVPGSSLNYLALFLTIIPLLTISGNLLVVLSVIRQRYLRTITNFFISSLAISDAIVAVMVMPFAVYVEVYTFPFQQISAFRSFYFLD